MALINDQEWQEIYDQIQYGLTHYGDNVAELIKIYKQIKTVLADHGFNKDNRLDDVGVREYPTYIAKAFLDLENQIKELNIIKTTYEADFSDIAQAIKDKGVNVADDDPYEIYSTKILAIGSGQTVISGWGAFNEEGYLSGDVIVPEGITNLQTGTIYRPDLITSLTFPKSLVSLGDYACSSQNTSYFPVNIKTIELPTNCTYIGKYCFEQLGLNVDEGAKVIVNALKSFDMGPEKIFFNGKVSQVIFTSPKVDGFSLRIGSQAFRRNNADGLADLTMTVPLQTTITLFENAFPQNRKLNINLDNVEKIIIENSASFETIQLSEEDVYKIMDKISAIPPSLFAKNNLLKEVIFDKGISLWTRMFYRCNNLKKITVDLSKLKERTFASNAVDISTQLILSNIDKADDDSIFYASAHEDTNRSPEDANLRLEMLPRRTRTGDRPYYSNIGIYNAQNRYSFQTYNMTDQIQSGAGYASRGYGLWTRSSSSAVSAEEVYQIMKKFKKNSNFFGILNNLKNISSLRLPYSSSFFWCGEDKDNSLTSSFEQIIFETSGIDSTMDDTAGTCPFVLTWGFNNLKKLIWKKTEPNSLISAQTLGQRTIGFNRSSTTSNFPEKTMQSLEEVYFGEGATVLQSYLFANLFSDNRSEDQYVYNYNSNMSIMAYNYPKLKTIYFPGSLKSSENSMIITQEDGTQSDNFYLHPLYCGIGNITFLNNLNQILLGPDWSLSIELTSFCFRNSSNKAYYNLALAPEAMIYNINNLKDVNSEALGRKLIVTDKTLTDLQAYCEENQGAEKTILSGTQCQKQQLIPTYESLINMIKEKNWTLQTVAFNS